MNKRARNSLIVAIVGFFVCGLILCPAAIYEGVKAKEEMRQAPWQTGEGLATAGITVGIIGTVLSGLWLLIILSGS